MKNKKNIDQLFKERFVHHEVKPPAHVWENIQAQLHEKKKDRVIIPLWWKVGGIAAALLLLFTLGNSIFDQNNTLVEKDNQSIKVEKDITPKIKKGQEINTNNNATQIANTPIDKTSDAITEQEKLKTKKEPVFRSKQRNTSKHSVVASITKNNPQQKNNTTQAIAKVETPIINKEKSTVYTNPENTAIKNTITIVESKKEAKITTPNASQIIQDGSLPIATETTVAIEENSSTNKKSIFDAIEEQKEIKTQDAVVKNNTPANRWEVAPNVAPVYYNTLTEGSSIDPSFADNTQSGAVNISYGVGIHYALSNKLKIRSGVSNVDLSYSTGGLELGDGPVSLALESINYDRAGTVLIAQDQGTFATQGDGTFGPITPKSTSGEAFINQRIKYYEVPLELSYALLNNKFGVDVIGGVSTLFLGDNEVSVNAGDFNETLGTANNLSSVSFSTNVGLGVHYKLSKKFKFNVEPMFKYQLNPYTDSSVDFKPYYVGVYTGLSFKF